MVKSIHAPPFFRGSRILPFLPKRSCICERLFSFYSHVVQICHVFFRCKESKAAIGTPYSQSIVSHLFDYFPTSLFIHFVQGKHPGDRVLFLRFRQIFILTSVVFGAIIPKAMMLLHGCAPNGPLAQLVRASGS